MAEPHVPELLGNLLRDSHRLDAVVLFTNSKKNNSIVWPFMQLLDSNIWSFTNLFNRNVWSFIHLLNSYVGNFFHLLKSNIHFV